VKLEDILFESYKGKDNLDGYKVTVWSERDNLQIVLYGPDGKEIAEWVDDDARQMFEDGFFNNRNLEKSVVEYAKDVGLIKA
jgi:hypothetical protein